MTSILEDREAWRAAAPEIQDAAIAEAARRLGPTLRLLGVEEHRAAGIGHRIARFQHRPSQIELMLLPGGRCSIGSATTPWTFDKPPRAVSVRPFLIGRFPVTQREWDRFPGAGDRRSRFGPRLPIHQVAAEEAEAWLRRAGLRLPAEAEWEYAARAGCPDDSPWGGGDVPLDACWIKDNSGMSIRPVTDHQDRGNAFGLVDVIGNVWEWCADHFFEDFRDGPVDQEPRSGPGPHRYVYRGAGWNAAAVHARVSNRNGREAGYRFSMVGLRAALSL